MLTSLADPPDSMPKFEVAELCQVVLGKRGHRSYGEFVLSYVRWSRCVRQCLQLQHGDCLAVLRMQRDSIFGMCGYQYVAYCFIMGIMVIPLSLMDLSEQMLVQGFLTVARFLSLGIMIVGPLVSLFLFSDNIDPDASHLGSFSDHIAKPVPPPPAGAGAILSACVFGLLFQHSVDSSIALNRAQEERSRAFLPVHLLP